MATIDCCARYAATAAVPSQLRGIAGRVIAILQKALRDRRPAPKLVGSVPEQPFVLAGAAGRRKHLGARGTRRGLGRAIADGDDLLHGFAKALVGIGVDPRAVGVFGRSLARYRAADIPIDPKARQQRRYQDLPGPVIGRGDQETGVGEAVRHRLGLRPPAAGASEAGSTPNARRYCSCSALSTATAPNADWPNDCNVAVSGALAAAIANARENWPR